MARVPSVTRGTDRVLWVTEELPDRALGGGSIRQAHLFEALAGRVATDLLMIGELRDAAVRAAAATVTELPRRTAAWSEHPVVRRALQSAITAMSRHPLPLYPAGPSRRALARVLRGPLPAYGAVCVEHEALAPLAGALPGVPSLITFHHLVSGMIDQELARTAGSRQRWFLRRDLVKAQELERTALRTFDRVVICSQEDGDALARLGRPEDAAKLAVVPNGVDLTTHHATPVPGNRTVLFPGSLNYAPNVDGALWFCHEIWPEVRAAVPDARLIVAGRRPVPQVSALSDLAGVTVVADVPSMAELFHAARVVVVPLRTGTGTRLKALEAMASGRPVVGTRIGLGGIGLTDGVHARIADEPALSAAAVAQLLTDDDRAARIGRAARTHVEEGFGWEAIGRHFSEVVLELAAAGAGHPAGPASSAAR